MEGILVFVLFLFGSSGFCCLCNQIAKIVVAAMICRNPKLSNEKVLAITEMMKT